MISFREQLKKIGEPIQGQAVPAFPSGFYTAPKSLRAAMKAMDSPCPETWSIPSEGQFFNHDWTEECQGVTHDDSYWYISSNHEGKQRVYRFSLANNVEGYVKLAGNGSGHLGDIDYYQDRIYCAMENPVKILIIDTPPFSGWWSAELTGESGGERPQTTSCPWCAVNPWNGLLYSSNFGDGSGEDTLYAYRFDSTNGYFVHLPSADIVLQEKVRRIQGAVFSKNGHVLLASDHTNDIRCYSTLNGYYLGRTSIQKDDSWNVAQEIEGLTIWEDVSYNGVQTHVHVVLLDNDKPDDDDVYFKHYRVPLAEYL
ncbi:MAG: hypothetical protein WCK96_07585 [Methylococcales bacterium]